MKTQNEFRLKDFSWLETPELRCALLYIMAWEPEFDLNTEIAMKYYEHDRHIFSQSIRKFSKYKIT